MPKRKRNKIQALYEAFAEAPPGLSACQFLFLNDEMSVPEISAILDDLSSKGFAGVVLSARAGLLVPYGSSSYWKKLRAIINHARRCSLSVWLCDDYDGPGGSCAGRLVTERPDLCARGLTFQRGYPPNRKGVIGVYRIRDGAVSTVNAPGEAGRCLVASTATLEAPDRPGRSEASQPSPVRGCLDILNPAAIPFYQQTMLEPLARHLKDYLGSTIVGIFVRSSQNQCPFPWTETLPLRFQEKFGYDLVGCLPSLVQDVGDFLRVRVDYYSLISDLTRDYYRSLSAWAGQFGLSVCAVIGEDGFIENAPHTQGSPFAALTEMTVPTTSFRLDAPHYLGDTPPSLFDTFTPKFASSVSRIKQLGSAYAVVWGGEGWGVTPLKLKQLIDRGCALGITTFFTSGAFPSIAGARKRDFPPSYHTQLPYWQDMGILSRYISRLSLVVSTGQSRTDTLVLFPTTSLRADTVGLGLLRKSGKRTVAGIRSTVRALLADQRDFDFLFEEAISSRLARFTDGSITVGPNRYFTLIIPWAGHITEQVFSFIRAAQENGVRIIFVGRYPDVLGSSESAPSGIGLTLVKDAGDLLDYLAVSGEARPPLSGRDSDKFVHQRRSYSGAEIYFFSYLGDEAFDGKLTLFGRGNPEAWDPETGQRFVISDFESSPDAVRFPVHFEPGKSLVYIIHPEDTDALSTLSPRPLRKSGEFFFPGRWAVDYRSDNMLRLDSFKLIRSSRPATFPALRALFSDARFGTGKKLIMAALRVFVESTRTAGGFGKKMRYRSYTTLASETRAYLLFARVLGLCRPGTGRARQLDTVTDVARYLGLFFSTPLPPEDASFEIEAHFAVGHIPRRASLVWEEGREQVAISVNGVRVGDRGKKAFVWDKTNRIADISDLVKMGTNRVVVRSRQESFSSRLPAIHWIEPLVVTGEFNVSMDVITGKRETTRHLAWGRKGTGNYSGTVTYRTAFRLPRRFAAKRAFLDLGDVRVACRVTLNGHHLGVRLWPPYRYELTEHLASGENDLEISVTNTAENLLGVPRPCGIVSDPKIVFFDS